MASGVKGDDKVDYESGFHCERARAPSRSRGWRSEIYQLHNRQNTSKNVAHGIYMAYLQARGALHDARDVQVSPAIPACHANPSRDCRIILNARKSDSTIGPRRG